MCIYNDGNVFFMQEKLNRKSIHNTLSVVSNKTCIHNFIFSSTKKRTKQDVLRYGQQNKNNLPS